MTLTLKSERLHIVGIVAENVKRLRLVEIKPKVDAGVIEISGANGSGKTSLLDCIWWALGGERNIQSQPIRDGEDAARITLDLGEVRVTRTFTREQSESHLVVESQKGAHYKSPQKLLDDLLSNLTFDPLEFADQMTPREQLETLKTLVPLEIDIDELDRQTQTTFDTRTGVGRDLRALQARVEAYHIGPEWPTTEIDLSGLLVDMQQAGEHNQAVERRRAEDREEAAAIAGLRVRSESFATEIEELTRKIDRLRAERAETLHEIERREQAVLERPEAPAPIDVATIRAQIEDARAVNEKVRLYRECQTLSRDLLAKEQEHEALTNAIDEMRARRAHAIATAPMPVPGLGFGEGEVTFNGLPFAQASSAQRLRVSLAIAMAMNPKLRVIRITNGSLLDDQSLAIVREMAEAKGYQVFIELVDTSGKVGIYMEEGAVAAVDGELAEALL